MSNHNHSLRDKHGHEPPGKPDPSSPTLEDLLCAGDGILSTFENLVAAIHDQDGMEILSERAAVLARSFLKKLRAIRIILHNDNDPEFLEVAERLGGKARDTIGAAIEVVKDLLFWADGATWPDPSQLDSQGQAIEELDGNDLYEKLIDAASDEDLLTEDDPFRSLLPDRFSEAMEGLREHVSRPDLGASKSIADPVPVAPLPEERSPRKKHGLDSDDTLFADLAERNARDRETRGAEERKRTELAAAMRSTHEAVELAYYGTKDRPTYDPFDENPREVLLTSAEWAPLILAAAEAWKAWPGDQVLKDDPIRTEGTGVEAAERIWRRATSGASEQEMARLLEDARRSLGTWDGMGNHCNSELGILTFFQLLYKYLGNLSDLPVSWNKSRAPFTPGSPPQSADPPVPEQREDQTGQPPVSHLQEALFDREELDLADKSPVVFDKERSAWIVNAEGKWVHDHNDVGDSRYSALCYLRDRFLEDPGLRASNTMISEKSREPQYSSRKAVAQGLHSLRRRTDSGPSWSTILQPPIDKTATGRGWCLVDPRRT